MAEAWPTAVGAGLALLFLGGLLHRAWVTRRTPTHGDHGVRPHYLTGLNYMISNQPDHAIAELSRAVRTETDAVEAYLALGNLFREKGQAERAIDIHKSLLHRPRLSEEERLQVLLSLGMDFKTAGLMDRAERTLQEVVDRDPDNLSGLHCLRQVYEEMGRWDVAVRIQQRIEERRTAAEPERLAAIHYEWGRALAEDGDLEGARDNYQRALDLDPGHSPAHLGMADCLIEAGRDSEALRHLEVALEGNPPWAAAALMSMVEPCRRLDELNRLRDACDRLLQREPSTWRARLVRGRLHLEEGSVEAARRELTEALEEKPGSLQVQRSLWEVLRREGSGSEEFVGTVDEAIDSARLVDPYVCMRCGFQSTELFARCPHCHQWDTVAEEGW